MRSLRVLGAGVLIPASLAAQTPRAITTDPARDTAHPARMEVLHIPSGGVSINGVAYVPPGARAHPTLILLHGLPGNEKNLDLAQAVRRAGWTVITLNYRGSWGSPGVFRFGGNLVDAEAALAFVRDTAHARLLGIDPRRVVIAGHSMGGWVAALIAARHPELMGAILISTADLGRVGMLPRDQLLGLTSTSLESLAGVTAESMADDMAAGASRWRLGDASEGLAHMPLLVLTSDDGLASHVDTLVQRVRALGNTRVTTRHQATDHSWSDRRIALQRLVLDWLTTLARSPH